MKTITNIFKTILAMGIFTFMNLTLIAQEKEYNKPIKGLHLAFGAHTILPTNNVIPPTFSDNNSLVKGQTLFNEWYTPSPGGFLEASININEERPFFIGFQHSSQRIFNDSHHIKSGDPVNPQIGNHYELTKRVSHRNNMLFAEAEIIDWRNFNLFGRAELGMTTYRGQANVHGVNSPMALAEKSFRSHVFTGGLGLGVKYQASERLAFRLMAGYRFETANNFERRNFFSGLDASINPKDENFHWHTIEEPNDVVRPIQPRNQNLYLQLGIVHHFDGRELFQKWGERGEPKTEAEKPILYLYPEEETLVNVSIELIDHEFIFTYPEYKNKGWTVVAEPDGTLTDVETDRKYYSLFWETEGKPFAKNLKEGFVVKGSETRKFLEKKLEHLGLNYKEANEFIIYWLPQMENNAYNAIYFAFDEYEEMSKLNIEPKPETLIRIMMMFEPMDKKIELSPQILEKAGERKGFTAVEWGGMKGEFFKKQMNLVQ